MTWADNESGIENEGFDQLLKPEMPAPPDSLLIQWLHIAVRVIFIIVRHFNP